MLDVGQDQLATIEGDETKAFSDAPFVPDFFRVESRRSIFCQSFREGANQRGFADSR
jgi:hypothetical protein